MNQPDISQPLTNRLGTIIPISANHLPTTLVQTSPDTSQPFTNHPNQSNTSQPVTNQPGTDQPDN
jgi:hypothetical protein